MLAKINFITLLFLIQLKPFEAKYADDCLTTERTSGKCLPIRSCSNVVNSLRNYGDNVPMDFGNSLRQNACGVFNQVQHICCANEYITLNMQGLQMLNETACGYFSQPRVAYGQEARLFTFPWMALLKYNDDPPFKCGATLITKRYVLTAAHCVDNPEQVPTQVRLGEHNITSEIDCQKFGRRTVCAPPIEDVDIEKIIIHPDFYELQNDIALIRLSRDVAFQDHIRAICLPISSDLRNNFPSEYLVSGWGRTENGNASDVLKYAVVPHKDLSVCINTFRLAKFTNQICAGGEENRDSCKGDSGGPITSVNFYNGRIRLIQYGIVSLGVASCGLRSLPGIYTSVGDYMQWLTDNIVE